MSSVTQRVHAIRQPHGGYPPVRLFTKECLCDSIILNSNENIHPALVGITVDYLTRFMLGDSVDKAFNISTAGATNINMTRKAEKLKSAVKGLDSNSIIAACKLAGFDVCFRATIYRYKPIESINPDIPTIDNIRTMVNRSLAFWKKYGPIVLTGPTFEGGYSDTIDTGDGDYITKDTFWDFKVSKDTPTSKHTLQILIYYILGLHSAHDYYKSITNLGIFNPRLNVVYSCSVSVIPNEVIENIETNVICYNTKHSSSSASAVSTVIISNTYDNDEKTYSVADICETTKQSKNVVYSNIHSGRLQAQKVGNKYVISALEYDKYIKRIEFQRHITLVFTIAVGIVVIVYVILFCKIL